MEDATISFILESPSILSCDFVSLFQGPCHEDCVLHE